ncbi:Crp/Fnr family transcriptional regulator [uncultured Clostridium sp.]|jgi:CRP-like cAMP-binding protein|uniref:Crp/Fnr family transcriptional regulator n=1 Tax=uncultured Clostridium sp. TaxID=59620 RepID=UPI0026135B1F|nr:Crp/Fnr family transcriptional regulator [uncultured Clostridium sp.]
MMTYFENLKESKLFASFSDEELQKLKSSNEYFIKSYKAEDVLFIEEEDCEHLSIILEGKVELQKLDSHGNILIVSSFETGNSFGEALLFGDRHLYPMSIVAKEKCTVIHIKKDCIFKLCTSNETFLKELLRLFSNKALILNSKLKQVSMKSLREMIAHFLVTKYNQTQDTTITTHMTKKEWSEKLGVRRPSLSRELIKMKLEGLIEYNRKEIFIKDIERLEEFI